MKFIRDIDGDEIENVRADINQSILEVMSILTALKKFEKKVAAGDVRDGDSYLSFRDAIRNNDGTSRYSGYNHLGYDRTGPVEVVAHKNEEE